MIWDAPKRGLLASLLVMIILACHGAYGVNHHYLCEETAFSSASAASAATASGGDLQLPAGEKTAGNGYFTYFMTLLSLLVGLYFLASRGRSVVLRACSRWPVRAAGLRDLASSLPARSSPPILQVYRL